MSRPCRSLPPVPDGFIRCDTCKQVKPENDYLPDQHLRRYYTRGNIINCADCREKQRQYSEKYRAINADRIKHKRKLRSGKDAYWAMLDEFLHVFGA